MSESIDKAITPKPGSIKRSANRKPSTTQLQRWYSEGGGCEASDGCWVEPDGSCEHGANSWLVILGFV